MAEVLKPDVSKTPHPIKFAFMHIEMAVGGTGFRLELMPVSYYGASTPVELSTMSVEARIDAFRVTDKEGKETAIEDNWWLMNLMSTLVGVFIPSVANMFTAARNGCAAGPILAIRQKHPGIRFIIRDHNATPLLSFNQMLTEAGVAPIEATALADIMRSSHGVLSRSRTSRSIETEPRLLDARFAEIVSLAADFFDLVEPHMEAGLLNHLLQLQEEQQRGRRL
jgi:hypothetical protein